MTIPSPEQLNSHIGRTTEPPDLLTLVDEHLRSHFQNIYAHPISLNTPKPWTHLHLGYIMISPNDMGCNNIGTIFEDRIAMSVSTGDVMLYATDPLFLEKLIEFFAGPKAKYINEFIRRR